MKTAGARVVLSGNFDFLPTSADFGEVEQVIAPVVESLTVSDVRGYYKDTVQFSYATPIDPAAPAILGPVVADAPPVVSGFPELMLARVVLTTTEDGRETATDVGSFRVQGIRGVRVANQHRIEVSAVRSTPSPEISERLLAQVVKGQLAELFAQDGRVHSLYRSAPLFYDPSVTTAQYLAAVVGEASGLQGVIQALQDYGFMPHWEENQYRILPVTDLYAQPTAAERAAAHDISAWEIGDGITDLAVRQDPGVIFSRMVAQVKGPDDSSLPYAPGGGSYTGREIVLSGDFPHTQGAYLRMVVSASHSLAGLSTSLELVPARGTL